MDAMTDQPYPGHGEFASTTIGDVALQLEAVVEPDADCDGYGDETQDRLPRAASAGACACPPSRVTIVGTTGNDVLVGTPHRDVIKGLSGKDKILGRGGNDAICADDGNHRLLGGAGNDTMIGGPGGDRVNGGPGRNRCSGQVLKRCQVVLPLRKLLKPG
jgi:Ca2+-binding RTX toxin-like protein